MKNKLNKSYFFSLILFEFYRDKENIEIEKSILVFALVYCIQNII